MTREEWEARKVELLEAARRRAEERELAARARRREVAAEIQASDTGRRHDVRLRLLRMTDLVQLDELECLVTLLEASSDADLRRTAAYLSALAEWPDPDVGST